MCCRRRRRYDILIRIGIIIGSIRSTIRTTGIISNGYLGDSGGGGIASAVGRMCGIGGYLTDKHNLMIIDGRRCCRRRRLRVVVDSGGGGHRQYWCTGWCDTDRRDGNRSDIVCHATSTTAGTLLSFSVCAREHPVW